MTAAVLHLEPLLEPVAAGEWDWNRHMDETSPIGHVPEWYQEALAHRSMVQCALKTFREVLWIATGLAALLTGALWMLASS